VLIGCSWSCSVAARQSGCDGVRETEHGGLGACGYCAFARGRARGVRVGVLAIRRPCVTAHAPDVRLGAPAHGAWLWPSSLAGWARRTVKTARRRPHGVSRFTAGASRCPYTRGIDRHHVDTTAQLTRTRARRAMRRARDSGGGAQFHFD
jgi:hypothetical protein